MSPLQSPETGTPEGASSGIVYDLAERRRKRVEVLEVGLPKTIREGLLELHAAVRERERCRAAVSSARDHSNLATLVGLRSLRDIADDQFYTAFRNLVEAGLTQDQVDEAADRFEQQWREEVAQSSETPPEAA